MAVYYKKKKINILITTTLKNGDYWDAKESVLEENINLSSQFTDLGTVVIADLPALKFTSSKVHFINEKEDFFNISVRILKQFYDVHLKENTTFFFDFVILDDNGIVLFFLKKKPINTIQQFQFSDKDTDLNLFCLNPFKLEFLNIPNK